MALLCEYYLLLALICQVVALDLDDDELPTNNGAWVSVAFIIGLSGGLLLMLFMLLKVGHSMFLSMIRRHKLQR